MAGAKLMGMWESPFVLRPRIAFNIKGVEYEYLKETVRNKSELLLKSNPVYKKIPVLLHGDKAICESMIITEYIDETWQGSGGPNILPKDPYDRAIAKFWAYFVDDKLYPAMMPLAKAQTEEEKATCLGQVLDVIQLLEGAFEKCGKGKGFFAGDSIGYVDIVFGSWLGWIKAIEKICGVKILDQEKTPLLVGWAERFCTEDAVKGVMPDTDTLIEYWKGVQARMKAAAEEEASVAAK